MIFAKVIGTVVAARKDENLAGAKLLLCREVDHQGEPQKNYYVAIDAVQAGEGDLVLVACGSSARMTEGTRNMPADAVIMAIIDEIDVAGKPQNAKNRK